MIYLDHAATSFPKPASVIAAITHWFSDLGVSAERGDSRRNLEVAQTVAATRAAIAREAGVPTDRVAFTSGATEALNLALRALLRPGDAVLTTAFEHSSVVRPLRALQRERSLRVDVMAPDPDGGLAVDRVVAALAAGPYQLFVFTHGSNVTGAVLDAAAFCGAAHRAGVRVLLDASQTIGQLPIAVGADVVAASAHKALHGPPGLGFLAAHPDLVLAPQKQGGTGTSAAVDEHPTTWPQAFEAGTPNTPAILGLHAALAWLAANGRERLAAAALARTGDLELALAANPAIRLYAPPKGPRLPITSFTHRHLDPAELGALLDTAGVHVRTGFHCAPWLHAHLGTSIGGTVRMSPGPLLSAADIAAAAASVAS